jgi:hypothetical protein
MTLGGVCDSRAENDWRAEEFRLRDAEAEGEWEEVVGRRGSEMFIGGREGIEGRRTGPALFIVYEREGESTATTTSEVDRRRIYNSEQAYLCPTWSSIRGQLRLLLIANLTIHQIHFKAHAHGQEQPQMHLAHCMAIAEHIIHVV